jgi:mannose/fructose-specific phosphotransferase system component IIA
MSEGRRGIVVAHGTMADGLVDAVRSITGAEADVLVAVSNRGLAPPVLAEQVRQVAAGGAAIVFTDLPTGSCGFAGRLLARELPDLIMICGVNLPMLLDFVTHRDLPLAELVPRLINKGQGAIASSPTGMAPHGDPAVSR